MPYTNETKPSSGSNTNETKPGAGSNTNETKPGAGNYSFGSKPSGLVTSGGTPIGLLLALTQGGTAQNVYTNLIKPSTGSYTNETKPT